MGRGEEKQPTCDLRHYLRCVTFTEICGEKKKRKETNGGEEERREGERERDRGREGERGG